MQAQGYANVTINGMHFANWTGGNNASFVGCVPIHFSLRRFAACSSSPPVSVNCSSWFLCQFATFCALAPPSSSGVPFAFVVADWLITAAPCCAATVVGFVRLFDFRAQFLG